VLQDHKLTSLVFKEIGPRFKNRAGGYTRIVHLDTRAGDGAKMAILSLVELKPKKSKTSPKKLKEKAVKTKEETTAPVRAEKQVAPKAETKKITPKETKKNTSEASKKDAEEKDKGFLKNLRSYLKKGNKE
jgi:large subunit ribosomal protein L17